MIDSYDSWLSSTDWREPLDCAWVMNNFLAAWVGYSELVAAEPDGLYAAEDRAQAERAMSMFLRSVEQAVLAGSMPPEFGLLLAQAESGDQAAGWIKPYVGAVRRHRFLAHEDGERAAVVLVARQHSRDLLAALERGANRTELLPLIAAAWADRLLSPEDAEALAGTDQVEARRRAAILGAVWR